MLDRKTIKELALSLGADLFGVADIALWEGSDPRHDVRLVDPEAKCVLGFGFRVPRALYKAMAEGRQYFNYTQLGVKLIDEEVATKFLLGMSALIEDHGYDACLQRSVPNLRVQGDKTQNPEVVDTYELRYARPTREGLPPPDVIIDRQHAAWACGLGSPNRYGGVITPEFGPFARFMFIVTDAPIETNAPFGRDLCDGCGKCAEACPGRALDGGYDTWQCSVHYRAERGELPEGARYDADSAREIYKTLDHMPSKRTGYAPCLCGRACDSACYAHLKEAGRI